MCRAWRSTRLTAQCALALAAVLSACAPAPCSECDPTTQFCQTSGGCGLFFGGNLNPDGLSTSSRCFDLPEECLDDRTCECLVCGPAATRTEDCQVRSSRGVLCASSRAPRRPAASGGTTSAPPANTARPLAPRCARGQPRSPRARSFLAARAGLCSVEPARQNGRRARGCPPCLTLAAGPNSCARALVWSLELTRKPPARSGRFPDPRHPGVRGRRPLHRRDPQRRTRKPRDCMARRRAEHRFPRRWCRIVSGASPARCHTPWHCWSDRQPLGLGPPCDRAPHLAPT